MATDAAAVLLALGASYVATLRPGPGSTFGYHRAEILAALLNALVLLGVCGYLAYARITRLADPTEVDAGAMIAFPRRSGCQRGLDDDPQSLRHRVAQPQGCGQRGLRRSPRLRGRGHRRGGHRGHRLSSRGLDRLPGDRGDDPAALLHPAARLGAGADRKSTRLNSSH